MARDMDDTVKLARLGRNAEVRAASVDQEARTVEVTWTAGAAVPRYMPGLGRVMEELEVSENAIRLERLNNGAPFLNTHSYWSLEDVIGVVERAWIEGGEGRALIRFSERESVEPIWRDVVSGILRNISVGYRVHSYEVIDGDDEGVTRVIAKDWEPMEISAVPIGADDMAGFRSENDENPCRIHRAEPANPNKETPMSETKTSAAPESGEDNTRNATPAPSAPAPRAEADIKSEAVTAERKRSADINALGVKFIGRGLEQDDITQAVNDGLTVDQARAAFLDKLADADDAPGETRTRVQVNQDEQVTRRSLAINALEHRLNPRSELEDGAREFRGMSLLRMGEELLAARGVKVRGLSRSELAKAMLSRGAHGTSDFPFILANVANKRLRAAYQAAPQTFRPLVNETTLPDFKTVSRVQLSDAPSFVRKLEGAEYSFGTMAEGREQYALATYGRGLTFTREMIINDDLSAFDRIVRQFGTSAANLESDLVWGLITGNPDLSDGTAVFHADHGNLATAGAISIANLGAARAKMRNQKSLAPDADTDGTLLNLEPAFLAVPAELETVALQYTRQTSIVTDPANQNPFVNSMQPIVEPRLASLSGGSADDWYLFASPNQVDIIEFAYLEGEQGPQLEQTEDFNTDGIKLKGRLDVGASWIDHRGAVKNAGS
ncbi:prohead protease/major capsid protein fusion protein [Oceanicaulis sp.]|uniref:prohead protease/major capsid protein fusion protein n=1 Tax=Oceanicaulis sp. TaxID=1924941 RepID=UPI003D2CFA4C